MKLAIKTEGDLRKVDFVDMSEEYGVALFSVAISYRVALQGLLNMEERQLLAFCPGPSFEEVKMKLRLQLSFCNDYIKLWQEAISKEAPAAPPEDKPKLFN